MRPRCWTDDWLFLGHQGAFRRLWSAQPEVAGVGSFCAIALELWACLERKNLASSFKVILPEGAIAPQPFTPETAPIRLEATGRLIPNWRMDGKKVIGKVQPSPVKSEQPDEKITLIPTGRGAVAADDVSGHWFRAGRAPMVGGKGYREVSGPTVLGDSASLTRTTVG